MDAQTEKTSMNTDIASCPDLSDRSPLTHRHGIFIADSPEIGGASLFLWFMDDAEAILYLRTSLLEVFDLDLEEAAHRYAAVASSLGSVSALKSIDMAALNMATEGLFEVRWVGSLDDLQTGVEPFELELQADYHEHAVSENSSNTSADINGFVDHLNNYIG